MTVPIESIYEYVPAKILEINKGVFGKVHLYWPSGVTDVYIEFELIYDELPNECTIQIGNHQETFQFAHVESTTTPYGLYSLKFYYRKVASNKTFSEWVDFLEEIGRKNA